MPSVSVAEYGLTFNPAAAELLGVPKYIAIGMNVDGRLVALKPVTDLDEVKNPLPFPGRTRGGAVRVNSRDLVRALRRSFNLADPSGRYLCRWDETKGQLLVDLNVRLDSSQDEDVVDELERITRTDT